MRALLAYDGSAAAAQAAAFTGAIPWPSDSTLRVVIAIEPMMMLAPLAWAGSTPDPLPASVARLTAYLEAQMGDVAKRLRAPAGRSNALYFAADQPAS